MPFASRFDADTGRLESVLEMLDYMQPHIQPIGSWQEHDA